MRGRAPVAAPFFIRRALAFFLDRFADNKIVLQSAGVGVYLNKNGDISMIRIMLFIVFCTAGIALSGCGSSNSSGPDMMQDMPDMMPDDPAPMPPTAENPSFAERARDAVTGANPPALTRAQIEERARGVVRNADALAASRLHVTTDIERVPEFVLESDCAGTTCTFTHLQTGLVYSVSLNGVSGNIEGAQTVLTRNGVTTFLQEAQVGAISVKAYGAWLEYGAFAVVEETGVVEGIELSGIYGLAGGRSSNSRPSVDATYRGLMVGSPVGGAHRGNRLQGDAELVYASADNEIDAHFTDIVDLDRGSPHATSRIDFENLAVDEDGIFADDQPGNGILGGFAGPDHAETVGTFESDGIVGAFGTARE